MLDLIGVPEHNIQQLKIYPHSIAVHTHLGKTTMNRVILDWVDHPTEIELISLLESNLLYVQMWEILERLGAS